MIVREKIKNWRTTYMDLYKSINMKLIFIQYIIFKIIYKILDCISIILIFIFKGLDK